MRPRLLCSDHTFPITWVTPPRFRVRLRSRAQNCSHARRFVYEGETLEDALAPGSARRRALDAALAEVEDGAKQPSLEWRREYSLLLGLERLLSEEEPKLVDGTVLSAHQVDALSGTLTALLAAAQATQLGNGNGNGRRRRAGSAGAAGGSRVPPRSRRRGATLEADEDEDEDEEPQDWQQDDGVDEDVREGAPDDPGADRRFWFEHATGAGKTVAALGFVEASRTGGVLILTHRRNLVDQFIGELKDRGYRDRIHAPLLDGAGRGQRTGHGRDLPVVRAQRRHDLRRLHDRDLRRGAHRARREDLGRDPRAGTSRSGSG